MRYSVRFGTLGMLRIGKHAFFLVVTSLAGITSLTSGDYIAAIVVPATGNGYSVVTGELAITDSRPQYIQVCLLRQNSSHLVNGGAE